MTEDSNKITVNLSQLTHLISILMGASALIGVFVTVPYRLSQAEKRLSAIEQHHDDDFCKLDDEQDHMNGVLIRIDENIKELMKYVDENRNNKS